VEAVPERIAGTSLMEFPTMRSKKTPSLMEGVLEKEGLVYLLHSILREKYMIAAKIRNKPILPASNAPSCN
jgi:hypothetical protein